MDKLFQKCKEVFLKENPALKEKLKKVREKGHTKLTVYVIPHGYDSTFNFHISIFTVVFIFLLILSLITLSIYGIYRSSHTRKEIAKLQSIHGKYFSSYLESRKYLKEIESDFSSLEGNLYEIFLHFNGAEEEFFKLISESELERMTNSQVREEEKKDTRLLEGRNYLKEIYELRSLKMAMNDRTRLLDANYNYVSNRLDVMESIPLRNPLDSWNLTSGFGMRKSPTSGFYEFHDGLDLANATGSPIYATAPGKVSKVIYSNIGYGNYLVLEHNYGFRTLYAHCSKIHVKPGQFVELGKKIAEVGTTGNVTGPHLHYEVWIGEGSKADPEEYLNAYNF